jgi:outer membrane lipoprotein-sorting protein
MALQVSALAAEDPAAMSATLLERIASAHHAQTSIIGTATQRTRHLDEPSSAARIQHIQFTLLFPDHYRLVFTTPGDDETRDIILSDGVMREVRSYLFKDEAPTITVTPVGADDAEVSLLLAGIRLDIPTLKKDFSIQAQSAAAGAGARVTLTPLRPAVADAVTSITVDLDATFAITRIAWVDPQGNQHEVVIDHAEYDTAIDPTLFMPHHASATPHPTP